MTVFLQASATITEGVSPIIAFEAYTDASEGPIYYKTRDGTAKSSSGDYTARQGALPVGSFTIGIPINDDSDPEDTEQFYVDLFRGSLPPASMMTPFTSAVGTIIDNDVATQTTIITTMASATYGFESVPQPTDEGQSGFRDFVYVVNRSNQSGSAVGYSVLGAGDHPANRADFNVGTIGLVTGAMEPLLSGTVTFGTASLATFTIQVRGDTEIESDEMFTVSLYDRSNGATYTSTTSTIRNDDFPVTPPSDPGPSTSPSSGPDSLTGGAGDNTIAGFAGDDTITSGDGNDLLYGNMDNDRISAGGGNNTVYGGMGADSISAGAGNDLLFGNEGADTISAGDGNNTIVGGQDSTDGADVITAGSGNDLILGNGGNDTISSTGGNDIVVGGFGNDVITLGAGNDIVYANQDNDTVDAGDGANLIFGGLGDDVLKTGSGNDTLYGNEGNDTLTGGGGADRYVFKPGDGADLVLGFSQAEGDKLDLQGQTVTSTQDVNGSVVLTLSGGGTITLSGIMANQVNDGFYIK